MTNLFKKSLLATALMAVAGVASAAQIQEADVTPKAVSKQSASGSFTTTGNPVSVTLGTALTGADAGLEVVVTYSGAQLSTAPTIAAAGTGETWTRTAVSANSATFRLDTTDGILTTEKLTISGHQWLTSSLVDADGVSITVQLRSATGIVVDPVGANQKLSRKIIFVGDEYGVKVATGGKMDREIDLSSVRTKFTSDLGGESAGNENTRYSRLTFNVAANTGVAYNNDAGAPATPAPFAVTTTRGDTDFTLAGDFSWIKDDNATTAGVQAKSGTITYGSAACSTKEITAAALKFTCTSALAAGDSYVKFDIYQGSTTAAPIAVADADYSLSAVQKYTPAGGTLTSITVANSLTAGSWTNNGETKSLDYMPFGAETSQIIYVTNLTAEVGKIYVTATLEDGSKLLSGAYLADTVANGITPLAAKLEAALAGKAVAGKKVALTFDIESSKATVYGAYKIGSDRALVVTR